MKFEGNEIKFSKNNGSIMTGNSDSDTSGNSWRVAHILISYTDKNMVLSRFGVNADAVGCTMVRIEESVSLVPLLLELSTFSYNSLGKCLHSSLLPPQLLVK